MPGALRFGTTADGAASPTDHWQINRAGIFDQLNSGAGIRFLHGHSVTPNDLLAVLTNTIDDFETGNLDWEIHKDNGLTTGSNNIGTKTFYAKIGPVVYIFGWIRTANDDVYIHQNQSNQYTPASDNCTLTNQTNLVIAFSGLYYTND